MASLRVIHLAITRKERDVVLAANQKQKTPNSFTFSSNPSISHGFWRLPEGSELPFLLAAKSGIEQLFETRGLKMGCRSALLNQL